jgi:hypothetical protein
MRIESQFSRNDVPKLFELCRKKGLRKQAPDAAKQRERVSTYGAVAFGR